MKEGMMQNLKMSAFVINKESYSLAAAILPPVFATIPFDEVQGCYVVIHQPSVQFSHNGDVQTLVLGSSWMKKSDFYEMYEPIGHMIDVALTEVNAIK